MKDAMLVWLEACYELCCVQADVWAPQHGRGVQIMVTFQLRDWGPETHRYKGVQHRAEERVHALQVLLTCCGILIPTLKAHLACMHPVLNF